MALQNRVTPLGELVADPARGLVYGNRGCLHDDAGRIRRRYAVKRWIACRLEFRGRRRSPLLQPGRYTELFFLDEATAFAAGHRPCAECRREDYVRFQAIWRELDPGSATADAIDARLHVERLEGRAQRHYDAELAELPDGAFVLRDGVPRLVLGRELLTWSAGGYAQRTPRPARERATLLTPRSLVAVLRAGWDPVVRATPPDRITDAVAKRRPYTARTITRMRNAVDRVYTQQGLEGNRQPGAREEGRAAKGYTGPVVFGIDPSATG